MKMKYLFRNTYRNLEVCYDQMEEEDLIESESEYRKSLIELCQRIAHEYGEAP